MSASSSSILTALRNLPPQTDRETPASPSATAKRRWRGSGWLAPRRRFAGRPRHIDAAIASFNGTAGDARSFDQLHDLLDQQAYRLAYWRDGADEINYRRFFDVNDLAGLRVDDPAVFDRCPPAACFELVAEGAGDRRCGWITSTGCPIRPGISNACSHPSARRAAAISTPGWEPPFYVVVERSCPRTRRCRPTGPRPAPRATTS